jgi:hypothetical protein
VWKFLIQQVIIGGVPFLFRKIFGSRSASVAQTVSDILATILAHRPDVTKEALAIELFRQKIAPRRYGGRKRAKLMDEARRQIAAHRGLK